jgi:hypothetical protein
VPGQGLVHDALAVGDTGQIGRDGLHAEFVRQGAKPLRMCRREGELGAAAAQQPRHSRPDSAGRATDQHDLAREELGVEHAQAGVAMHTAAASGFAV